MAITTLRKGARIRYVGSDPRYIEAWGRSIQTVEKKIGSSVYGYFPMKYADGSIHYYGYMVNIGQIEIVK